MPRQYLDAMAREKQTVNPLFNTLKAKLTRDEDGEAEIRLPVGTHIVQGANMVAGGVLATLADEAMAHALMSVLSEGRKIVTAEMNIRYLRGAAPEEGVELLALARLIRQGKHICVAEAEVKDSRNRLLAIAGASFFLLEE